MKRSLLKIVMVILLISTTTQYCFSSENSNPNIIQNSETDLSEMKSLQFSLIPVFETHILFNLNSIDESLDAYGFTPLDTPLLISWGIKARFYEKSGLSYGAKVTYGNQTSTSDEYQVPTYTAFTKMGYFMGKRSTTISQLILKLDFQQ